METIYVVYFVGEGFGFHVYEESWHKGHLYGRRSVSGPYTTKAQAEAKAEALRVMADPYTPEPEASKHSYRVRAWRRA